MSAMQKRKGRAGEQELARLDRQDWRFMVPLAALADDLSAQPPLLDLTAELSLTGFCMLVRERLPETI